MFVVATMALRADKILADFEGSSYGDWKTTGSAFGSCPAIGTHQGQMQVSGYKGKGLVNTYLGGDDSTGTLTSPEFTLDRNSIHFLIGGGKNAASLRFDLLVDGKPVRSATGPNDRPGGSEALRPAGWDVKEFQGKKAQIQIIDDAKGGWGHINVDHIVLTDKAPPMTLTNVSRTLKIDKRYLLIPIKRGAERVHVKFDLGTLKTSNLVSLADDKADWWASMDVSQYKGSQLTITAAELNSTSKGLANIKQVDTLPKLYRETYRPQYHFSSKSGWLNDPNGLVYYNGEYHMFFQHDPVDGRTEYKLWGHAISKDLVHWKELPDALYPDELGSMWSGSAVVDWKNTSGLGKDGNPPLVLLYTAAGKPSSQCLAYTNDGRSFTKLPGNPIIPEITGYNRDPKVIWHEPSKHWVMTLYVEHGGKHFIDFFTSKDLIKWEFTSQTEGYYECPDFFELPVLGTNEKKWVLSAANSDYQVGTFDGRKFTPETPMIRGHFGDGYYAPQSFSDVPDGRRIQVGWMWTNPPEMPFTQSMSIPMTLELEHRGGTYRVVRKPIAELETIEKRTPIASQLLSPGDANPLADLKSQESHIHLDIRRMGNSNWNLMLRGVEVRYKADTNEIEVAGKTLKLTSDTIQLDAYVDRIGLEVFVNGDYIPLTTVFDPKNRDYSLTVLKGSFTLDGFVGIMKSIWK